MSRSLIFATTCLLVFSAPTFALQKKRPIARKPKSALPVVQPKVDARIEATQTTDTLKALTKFIYLYGKIANGLEVAEDQSKRTRPSASVMEKNAENKNGVLKGINGLKEQVDKLGQTLQANPKLQVQYVNLAGVTQKIVEAMQLVGSSHFDDAGRSLVVAAERLADILMQIR